MRLRRNAKPVERSIEPQAAAARVFVEPELTPEALVYLYQQHLTSEATAMLGPNIGRWMRVSGPRGDVVRRGRKGVLFRFQRKGSRPATRVEMNFDGPDWRDRLTEIPSGTEIAVVGVLRAATRSQITLDHCELDDTIGG